MPSRLRRAMRPAPRWGVWPSEATKLPDTCRNRVARSIYDVGDWLDNNNTTKLAEQTANYTGIMVLMGTLLQWQQDSGQAGESLSGYGSTTQQAASETFDALMTQLAEVAKPVVWALGAAIGMRCVAPALVGGAALGARVLGCSLIEVEKGPDVSPAARKLMQYYGGLPPPLPKVTGQNQSKQAPAAPKSEPHPECGKKACQRPGCVPPFRRSRPQDCAALRRAAPVTPVSRASLAAQSESSLESSESSLESSASSLELPAVGVAWPAPSLELTAVGVASPAPKAPSARARRQAKATMRAAAPGKARGPIVTGLSYDNRVVVEQADGLHWHALDKYPAERLHRIRPAPHKSVARAHRHRPAPELRQALHRVLRTRQASGLRAQDIVDALGRYGYHTYLVGGVVRDLLRCPTLALPCPDVDLVTDAPTSEVQRLVEKALALELPDIKVTSSHMAHYQGVISYQNIDIASIRVRGMFEPKRLNHATGVQVYPLSFGTCLPPDADNRDMTCNALYYDPLHDLLLDPTTRGMADAQAGVLRAPCAALAMMNATWALRYLKFILRGYLPADAAATQLMAANARKFFSAPRFVHALERIHEGDFCEWCDDIANVLAQMGCDDLAKQVCHAAAHRRA